MAQNIISERWGRAPAIVSPSSPYVQSGQFDSPTMYRNSDILSAIGVCSPELVSGVPGPTPNAFQAADSVLIRRVRLWSAAQGLGLAGGGVRQVGTPLTLWASRHNSAGFGTGKGILLQSPLVLGEWVDVNETLTADEIPAVYGSGDWLLSCDFQNPMQLDSSRMASGYIGSAWLGFMVQVDLAHTLPAQYLASP